MKQPKRGPRAFTLIEVMVAVCILGIVLATVGPTFRKSSISTKGGALTLAAALTEARQQAITQQVPVALVIPSDNGTQGQADSYYIASGEQPRVTQVKWFGGEQPDLRFMVGHWPLDTTKLQDSALTTTVTPPPEAIFESDLDVKQWSLTQSKDFAFIFTPRGKLVTNGLPHFDGAYHILVSQGGQSTSADLADPSGLTDPRPLFTPSAVGSPYTVTIDPAGAVSVTPGVVGAFDGAAYIGEQAPVSSAPNPAVLAQPPSSAPVVTSVKLLPDPAKLSLPTGVDMLLAPGRHMTMTMRAKSPDGVPLFCQWKATGGGLSSPEEVRTTYLPQTQEWESVWQWRFPADAKTGDQFTIEGVVNDSQGNQSPVGLGVGEDPFVVQVGDDSASIVFVTTRDAGDYELYTMNVDGTALRRVTDSSGIDYLPVWSPDGNQIAFCSNRAGSGQEVYVCQADGTGLVRLTNNIVKDAFPQWSPDGTRLLFTNDTGYQSEIYVVGVDGTGLTNLTNNTVGDYSPVWSPDGSKIAYSTGAAGNMEIFVMNPDGSGKLNLTNDPSSDLWPVWSPDGSRISFASQRDNPGSNGCLYLMNSDGSAQTKLNDHFDCSQQCWSPDGKQIVYKAVSGGYYDIWIVNDDGSGDQNLTASSSGKYGPCWMPDGRIAFYGGSLKQIMAIKPDGSGLTDLTKSPIGSNYHHKVR